MENLIRSAWQQHQQRRPSSCPWIRMTCHANRSVRAQKLCKRRDCERCIIFYTMVRDLDKSMAQLASRFQGVCPQHWQPLAKCSLFTATCATCPSRAFGTRKKVECSSEARTLKGSRGLPDTRAMTTVLTGLFFATYESMALESAGEGLPDLDAGERIVQKNAWL
jgi:hypothetical protein